MSSMDTLLSYILSLATVLASLPRSGHLHEHCTETRDQKQKLIGPILGV